MMQIRIANILHRHSLSIYDSLEKIHCLMFLSEFFMGGLTTQFLYFSAISDKLKSMVWQPAKDGVLLTNKEKFLQPLRRHVYWGDLHV